MLTRSLQISSKSCWEMDRFTAATFFGLIRPDFRGAKRRPSPTVEAGARKRAFSRRSSLASRYPRHPSDPSRSVLSYRGARRVRHVLSVFSVSFFVHFCAFFSNRRADGRRVDGGFASDGKKNFGQSHSFSSPSGNQVSMLSNFFVFITDGETK